MKLYTVIAFHYVEERLKYLETTLAWLIDMDTEYNKIVIQTNDVNDEQYAKLKKIIDYRIKNLEIEIEPIRNLKDPYMLTWAHKCRMLEFLDSPMTHFAYLEDDMVLSQELVDYWCQTRERFKKRNLNFIPGFLRVEYNEGRAWSVDVKEPYNIKQLNGVILDQPYVSLPILSRNC